LQLCGLFGTRPLVARRVIDDAVGRVDERWVAFDLVRR
jgi:hypothetical protein